MSVNNDAEAPNSNRRVIMEKYEVLEDDKATYYYKPGTGIFHREHGPAIVHANGHKEYWLNGKRHREDGPAIVLNGHKEYWVNGKLHREHGPAVELPDGYKAYFVNGRRHREDGPAVVRPNGDNEYWLNGTELTYDEWKKEVNQTMCFNKIIEIEGIKYKLTPID